MYDIHTSQSAIADQIRQLGTEWAQMSDAKFWNEADARARLLSLLCTAPELVVESSDPKCGGETWSIPLAHAECLGAKRRRGLQGPFDIVVFGPESIREYVREVRWDAYGWQQRLRTLSALAAIEIKHDKGESWNDEIEKDLAKLLQRVQTDPIQQGHLVVLYDAERHPVDWSYVERRIREICNGRIPRVTVYFFPWGRQPDEARAIDIESLS